jgi:hypothetical protein
MRRVELPEQEWGAIRRVSGLPDSARESIEYVLGYYRAFQQSSAREPRARDTRKELLRIAKLAEKLITAMLGANSLHNPRVKPHMLAALMMPTARLAINADDVAAADRTAALMSQLRQSFGTPTTRDALQSLYDRVLAVEQLRLWFENAARLLPAETSGAHKSAENHRWLVRQLDTILVQHTGQHISGSKRIRRYVDSCFAVVDSNVSPSSIKYAIEDCIAVLNRQPQTART